LSLDSAQLTCNAFVRKWLPGTTCFFDMAKFFLLSIVIALISIPARAARHENPRVGLRAALINMAVFDLFYMIGLKYLFGRSGSVHAAYMAGIILTFRYLEKRSKKVRAAR